MTSAREIGRVARFGVFEADLRTRELRRKGIAVALEDQPFTVLAMLLEHAGDLVTRAEIRERLWAPDVFVDFEHALDTAIHKIREVLGDLAENPRFVETLKRRGYRFTAPVEWSGAEKLGPRTLPAGVCRLLWQGQTFPLHEGDNAVGRDPGADVFLDSPSVSRHHACIRVTSAGVTVVDAGSKNGTYVGAHRVAAPVLLDDGDEVRVGRLTLLFRAPSPAGETKTVRAET